MGAERRLASRLPLALAGVSYLRSMIEIHPSARKHGTADEDIEHAVTT
jgi:hypothetical protein